MTTHRRIETYLMDMDGVLVHEERLIPGADQFIKRLQETGHRFLMLTNNSIYTPRDLAARLALTGPQVPEESIWTSALATARFLDQQRPQGTAYVIGEAGLTTALHERATCSVTVTPTMSCWARPVPTAPRRSPGLSG
jgi:NagD protein